MIVRLSIEERHWETPVSGPRQAAEAALLEATNAKAVALTAFAIYLNCIGDPNTNAAAPYTSEFIQFLQTPRPECKRATFVLRFS
jgi:hypothetical protein